jgi:hypothetical protein
MENEIYLHSVKKENFEVFFEINQNYQSVIDKLSKEFWKTLEEYLKDSKEQLFTSITDENFCLYVKIKGWKDFYVFIEWVTDSTINIGIYNEKQRSRKADIIAFSELLIPEYKVDNSQNKICVYKGINEDFTKLSGLKRLLPETKEEFCNEIIEDIRFLVRTTSNVIKEIEKRP